MRKSKYNSFDEPFHERVTGNDDAAAQCDGGEIPAVSHLIGVGQPDAQHMGHILHGQHQEWIDVQTEKKSEIL